VTYSAAAAIRVARGEIGYRESGTNDTKYNRWNGRIPGYPHDGYGYPWCATFQGWVAARAGGRANVDYPKTAGCAVAVAWFKSKGRWDTTPRAGDWVFYGPGGGTHVELVAEVDARTIRTIGGNTSGSLSGRYFNGDGVYAKSVSRSSDRIYGYGRPNYASEDDMKLTDTVKIKDWVRKRWPKDEGLADGAITVNTALGSGYAYSRIAADTSGQVLALLKSVADRVGAPVEVDADAVAQAVLAQLTPERIAAAIPAELAEQVVSALGARLAPKE